MLKLIDEFIKSMLYAKLTSKLSSFTAYCYLILISKCRSWITYMHIYSLFILLLEIHTLCLIQTKRFLTFTRTDRPFQNIPLTREQICFHVHLLKKLIANHLQQRPHKENLSPWI